MADEVTNINPKAQTQPIPPESNSVVEGQIPPQVSNILNKANAGVGDIVRIRALEKSETGLMTGIYSGVRDRFYYALGITLDPTIFAEMTDTLNKQRQILEMNSTQAADDYTQAETKKAA